MALGISRYILRWLKSNTGHTRTSSWGGASAATETKQLFAKYVYDGEYIDFLSDDRARNTFPFGEHVHDVFTSICDFLNSRAAEVGDPTKIHFGLTDAPVLGAWTYACGDSNYIIAVSVGAYLRLRAFFYILSLTGSFNTVREQLPSGQLSGPTVLGFTSTKSIDKTRHVRHIFPQDPNVEQSTDNFNHLLSLPLHWEDDRHLFDTASLLNLSLAYLFWHEIGHIVCGHLDVGLPHASPYRLCERPDHIDADSAHQIELSQGYELLADHYASLILATNLPTLSYPPAFLDHESLIRFSASKWSLIQTAPLGESFFYRAAYAILATLVSFELTWSYVSDYASKTHPHPEIRYSKMAASGIELLTTDRRGDDTPEAWSPFFGEPPSMFGTWQLSWLRAFYDLSSGLGTLGLPNVLYWSNRTDISRYQAELSNSLLVIHSARQRAEKHGKRHLSLDAYWDNRFLKPAWFVIPGADIEVKIKETASKNNLAAESAEMTKKLVGVYAGHGDQGSNISEILKQQLGSHQVLTFAYDDYQDRKIESAEIFVDLLSHDRDIFFEQCDHVVATIAGDISDFGFLLGAYNTLGSVYISG